MCGIVALINKTGQTVDSRLLEKMANAIHHRGPDENGIMVDGPVGFFHKRLSIIDLTSGQQPMVFNNCTIIFNGEIYNYIELREELKKKGHSFHTTSDTEVILHLYAEYGANFVNFLNGMFALIIYDNNQNHLFIARDHFGIKPLYWYQDDDVIAFGSEIKALLVHPRIKAIPDTNNVYEYLTFQFVMGESTMFQNIQKVLQKDPSDTAALSARATYYIQRGVADSALTDMLALLKIDSTRSGYYTKLGDIYLYMKIGLKV